MSSERARRARAPLEGFVQRTLLGHPPVAESDAVELGSRRSTSARAYLLRRALHGSCTVYRM